VRYLLAAELEQRAVIESVRVPAGPARPDGPNLLDGPWLLSHAEQDGPVLRLRCRGLWSLAAASQKVKLRPDSVYRLSLDVRGPAGGADHYLGAGVFPAATSRPDVDRRAPTLRLHAGAVGPDWRHFEYAFLTDPDGPQPEWFYVYSAGERPVEVRNVRLAEGFWPAPAAAAGLEPGARVYRRLAVVPALRPGDLPVAIYENRLCPPAPLRPHEGQAASPEETEALRWSAPPEAGGAVPDFTMRLWADVWRWAWWGTLPAAGAYAAGLAAAGLLAGRRRGKSVPDGNKPFARSVRND